MHLFCNKCTGLLCSAPQAFIELQEVHQQREELRAEVGGRTCSCSLPRCHTRLQCIL